MTVRSIPWRLIGYAIMAGCLLWGAASALSYVPFSPFWSLKRTAAKADQLAGQVDTLTRQAAGQAAITSATEVYHTREVIVREIAAQAEAEARNAPDATTPLSDERANRLRHHDQRMCNEFPAICAVPDPAVSGPDAVPASGPAG